MCILRFHHIFFLGYSTNVMHILLDNSQCVLRDIRMHVFTKYFVNTFLQNGSISKIHSLKLEFTIRILITKAAELIMYIIDNQPL